MCAGKQDRNTEEERHFYLCLICMGYSAYDTILLQLFGYIKAYIVRM